MKKRNQQQIEFVTEPGHGEPPHIWNRQTGQTEPVAIGKTYTVEAKADGVVVVWHGVPQDRFDQLRAMDTATRTLAEMVRVMGPGVVGIEAMAYGTVQ